VRVSGLYGLAGSAGKGGNFVETMKRLAGEGKPVRVVSDQVTAPTNTAEIAEGLLPLVLGEERGHGLADDFGHAFGAMSAASHVRDSSCLCP
jgi:dTDP-4-dehydrorhamnose reductase